MPFCYAVDKASIHVYSSREADHVHNDDLR